MSKGTIYPSLILEGETTVILEQTESVLFGKHSSLWHSKFYNTELWYEHFLKGPFLPKIVIASLIENLFVKVLDIKTFLISYWSE